MGRQAGKSAHSSGAADGPSPSMDARCRRLGAKKSKFPECRVANETFGMFRTSIKVIDVVAFLPSPDARFKNL
jgi:hypothetical protein